jgi:hypothetical protein
MRKVSAMSTLARWMRWVWLQHAATAAAAQPERHPLLSLRVAPEAPKRWRQAKRMPWQFHLGRRTRCTLPDGGAAAADDMMRRAKDAAKRRQRLGKVEDVHRTVCRVPVCVYGNAAR